LAIRYNLRWSMASAENGASSETLVGRTLQGRYRLTRVIGKGGMGAVYEAVQIPLQKRVAVKVMARELSANEEALARFRREAEVTSQLGHPHIVQVFDFGATPAGEHYLVMEYLEGEDLERRLARVGRFSLAATAHVVKQVAAALSTTHARDIVHRDLKPANVFLQRLEEEDDFVKVVDFGISKVRLATTKLTGERAVLGTPSYMSPEQANGRIDDIDRRTDEWSLACIAYEMLTGHPPFRGDDASAILYQVIYRTPSPVNESVPELPADVDRVLGRALSKAQGDRFPTVSAFARALEAVAAGRALPADEANVTGVEVLAPAPVQETAATTTTFSNTAAELTGPAGARARPPVGTWRYLVAVGVAVTAAVVVLSFRSPRVLAPPAVRVTPPIVAGKPMAAPPAPVVGALPSAAPPPPAAPSGESRPPAPAENVAPPASPPSPPAVSGPRRSPASPLHPVVPARSKPHLIQDL